MDPSNGASMDFIFDDSNFLDECLYQDSGNTHDSFESWLNKDRPWHLTGAGSTSAASTHRSQDQASHYVQSTSLPNITPAFQTYRNAYQPSDCDTIPGESVHGSCIYPSIDNTSLFGDAFSAGIPEIEDELSGLTIPDGHFPIDTHFGSSLNTTAHSLHIPKLSESTHVCPKCKAAFQSKGDLKKHVLRHKKTHRCPHSSCKKAGVGFTSNNDLIRHRRSVHSEPLNGPVYICRHGECVTKEAKHWPRADNFRSHLKRCHDIHLTAETNLASYRFEPSRQFDVLEGVGTNLQDPKPHHIKEVSPTAAQSSLDITIIEFPEISSQPRLQESAKASMANQELSTLLAISEPGISCISPSMLEKHANPMTGKFSAMSSQPGNLSTDASMIGTHLKSLMDADLSFLDTKPPRQNRSLPGETGTIYSELYYGDGGDDDSEESDLTGNSVDNLESIDDPLRNIGNELHGMLKTHRQGVLGILKSLPREILAEALKDYSSTTSNTGKRFECDKCNKIFQRQCELRKHGKRHERPYGCTWNKCPHRFGSKNDWKRHETTQHALVQLWHCAHQDCQKLFNDREIFRAHLRDDHRIAHPALLESTLEDNRLGSHCRMKFWCGFCKKLMLTQRDGVEQGGGGGGDDSSAIRFDHIDDHFMGRRGEEKRNVKDWQYMEDLANEHGSFLSSEPCLLHPTESTSRKRKRVSQPLLPLSI